MENGRIAYHLQFIGLKEHHGESALVGAATTIGVLALVGAILLHGSHRTTLEEGLRENVIVADDRGPGRIAAQPRQVILARLRVQVGNATLGLLPVQLGGPGRDAAVLGGLLSGSRGSVDLCRGRRSLRIGGGSFGSIAIGRDLSLCLWLVRSGLFGLSFRLVGRFSFCWYVSGRTEMTPSTMITITYPASRQSPLQ